MKTQNLTTNSLFDYSHDLNIVPRVLYSCGEMPIIVSEDLDSPIGKIANPNWSPVFDPNLCPNSVFDLKGNYQCLKFNVEGKTEGTVSFKIDGSGLDKYGNYTSGEYISDDDTTKNRYTKINSITYTGTANFKTLTITALCEGGCLGPIFLETENTSGNSYSVYIDIEEKIKTNVLLQTFWGITPKTMDLAKKNLLINFLKDVDNKPLYITKSQIYSTVTTKELYAPVKNLFISFDVFGSITLSVLQQGSGY